MVENSNLTPSPNLNDDENLEKKEKLIKRFDFMGIGEMIAFLRNPFKVFFINLLAGIGRGLGFAIGFMILAAILVLLLKRAVSVPVIGGYISRILEFIETQRQMYR